MTDKKISKWDEKRSELKKVKNVLLKIIECERVEAIDKLQAIQLIIDIDEQLNRL